METSDIIKGSHLKKIVRHGSLYMISSFLVKSANAFLLPVYTRYLEPAEYAVFSNLMAIGAIAAIFISLYLDSAYARLFFDAEHDRRQLRSLFSTIFLFFLSWGVLAAVAAFFIIRHRTSRLLDVPWYPYILLACIIPLVTQMNSLANVHFRSQHKSGTITGARLAGFAVGAAVSIILLVWGRLGAQSLLWGVLARACVIWLWYYGVLIREGLIGWDFSFKFLREGLTYSLALLPMGALGWLSGSFDKLLITWFGSMADSGIYSVAFEVGRIMNIFVLSLFMVYSPMIYAMLKEDAKKHIARIEQFQSFYFHVLIGMAFLVSIFTREVFQLLVEERYHGGISLVPVIAFAFAIGGIRKLYATLIYYHKLTLLISLGGIMHTMLSFGLNVVFIPRFGGKAAAWSKLFSMIFVAVYFWLLSRKYEPLRLDRRALGTTLSILAVCLGALAVCVYVLRLAFWPLLAAKFAIVALAVVLTWRSCFGDELRRVLSRRKERAASYTEQPEEPRESVPETGEG